MKTESGLKVAKPRELILGFANSMYHMYDGVAATADNKLCVNDIAISTMLNSRISGNTGAEIYKHKDQIERALRKIPTDIDLISIAKGGEIPGLEGIAEAVDVMCAIPRVKLAVSTKILHKKRPSIIPIFDSMVDSQYYQLVPGHSSMEWGEYCNAMIRLVHNDMLSVMEELLELCTLLKKNGTPMTPLRVLNAMTWAVKANRVGDYC